MVGESSGGAAAAVLQGSSRTADSLLQREARAEVLARRWADQAVVFADHAQEALCYASERWPVLKDGVRYDVTTLNEVVLADVRTVAPYRRALEEDEERLRSRSLAHQEALIRVQEALAAESGGAPFSCPFSFLTPTHVAEASGSIENALSARAAAFELEAERCERAHAAFLQFSSLAERFSGALTATVSAVAGISGSAAEVLPAVCALWAGGEELAERWTELQEQDGRCAAAGVVGTRLALVRLACMPETGYAAVRSQVEQYVQQLELEQSLHEAYEERAAELSPWIAATAQRFLEAPLPSTLAGAEAAWTELCSYLSRERPARARELGSLIELRQGIGAALAAHGRPGALPLAFAEVDTEWGRMEAAVQAHAAALSAELKRLRTLGDSVQRFTTDALELLDWLRERAGVVARELQGGAPSTRNEARTVKALVSAYAVEYADRAADLAALRTRGNRILAERYERGDKVARLYERLAEGMAEASLDPNERRLPPLDATEGEHSADE